MSFAECEASEAYILHTYPYQENSLILDAFTLNQGRVRFLAKDAKNKKKSCFINLQAFQEITVNYLLKKNLSILTSTEAQQYYSHNSQTNSLSQNKPLYCAYYLNELLLRLLPEHESYPQLYQCYKVTLGQLFSSSPLDDNCLRVFELNLLVNLGYQIDFLHDGETGADICSNREYIFLPDYGMVDALSSLRNKAPAQLSLYAISGVVLSDLVAEDFSNNETNKQIKMLLRGILQHYLDYKPLKSREVYRKLFS